LLDASAPEVAWTALNPKNASICCALAVPSRVIRLKMASNVTLFTEALQVVLIDGFAG
jgi:hypothetical protein